MSQVLAADLTWTGDRFESGVQVAVDDDGRIEAVGALGRTPDARLAGRALLPGFVTAHSHAFQRGLRGRGETFPRGSGSFWTWREAMYDLVSRLDAPTFRALCILTFREMRAAGVTTVGEFHYFHHREAGPDAADYEFDSLVLQAAAEAGIRIALIQSYYHTGAVGQPLEGAQRRFRSPSPQVYWEQMDRLAGLVDSPRQTLAASVHSLRAAGPADLAAIYDEARRRDLPFHIHVEEQQREIEDVIAYYGQRPMALLLETLGTAMDLTAVHCTHTDGEEMERFLAAGGTVCFCPLTEGNLGDGIPTAPRATPRAAPSAWAATPTPASPPSKRCAGSNTASASPPRAGVPCGMRKETSRKFCSKRPPPAAPNPWASKPAASPPASGPTSQRSTSPPPRWRAGRLRPCWMR